MKNCISLCFCLLLMSMVCAQSTIPFRDTVFCTPQNISIMQPEVQDSIEFFEWTLNNEKIDRIQNIKIEKTTKISYNLKTRKLPNLIVNGDFENGDRDFRTQYELSPSKCSGGGFSFCEGAYAITSNPQNNHS